LLDNVLRLLDLRRQGLDPLLKFRDPRLSLFRHDVLLSAA
jgi:hypothetical protein